MANKKLKGAKYKLEENFEALPVCNKNLSLVINSQTQKRITGLISSIWEKENPKKIYQILLMIMRKAYRKKAPRLIKKDKSFNPKSAWSEKDFYLICYGNHLLSKNKKTSPLGVLGNFLKHHFPPSEFPGLTVHLLPFYASPFHDRGFDVANPFVVNSKMGNWQDINQLAQHHHLAFDFVANHLSKDSVWFQRFLADDPSYADFFIAFNESKPDEMIRLKEIREKYQKLIYRPRAHDPFVRVKKKNGNYAWIYMTFSDYQPDVNYANPKVFFKMTETLLFYILKGATTLRLDAIPYLWKEWGTSCAHHPKTHALIELFRIIIDAVSPSTKLLAESMEPPQDSARYLSSSQIKKAHMAYNFLLCGLIPHTIINQNTSKLQKALQHFQTRSEETTQAVVCGKTHDGSSLNACRAPKSAKGKAVLKEKEIDQLAKLYTQKGLAKMPRGFVKKFKAKHGYSPRFANYKTITNSRGKTTKVVYEVISTYASLFENNPNKIVAALALGLPIKGIPFVYFTAPLATLNDYQYFLKTGNPRQLNEGSIYIEKLEKNLKNTHSLPHQVFIRMFSLLKIRTHQKAFHPNGAQVAISTDNKSIFSLLRISPDRKEKILALHNVSNKPQRLEINLNRLKINTKYFLDVALKIKSKAKHYPDTNNILSLEINPYQILWLKACG